MSCELNASAALSTSSIPVGPPVALSLPAESLRAASLILVATPIGNLDDLSPRAVAELRAADVIACEDTRHTRKLLAHAKVTGKRLIAIHEHNEHEAAPGVVALLQSGQTVALVTDAGTPGISDPGARVVAAVAAAGFDIRCVPGPAALIVALVVSGLATDRFCFEGFLPRRGAERQQRLTELASERRTSVLYEAPHRVVELVHDLRRVCGDDRSVSVSRELTKRFEQTWRGSLGSAVDAIGVPRGEYVVVLAGAPVVETVVDDDEVLARLSAERARGSSTRDAVDAVASATGRVRRDVYALATGPHSRAELPQ